MEPEHKKQMRRILLHGTDICLQRDTKVVATRVDCTTYVRNKLNQNAEYIHRAGFPARTWPKNTDTACLHCCHGFKTVPIPIPRRFDEKRGVFYVFGMFCSVNCGKGYLLEHERSLSTTRMLIFNQMVRNVFGIRSRVKPAPPRIRLRLFGGALSIVDFRNNFHTVSVTPHEPPFVPSTLIFEQVPDNGTMDEKITSRLRKPIGTAPPSQGMYAKFLARKKDSKLAQTSQTSQTSQTPKPSPCLQQPKRKKAKKKPCNTPARNTLNKFLTFQKG